MTAEEGGHLRVRRREMDDFSQSLRCILLCVNLGAGRS